MIKKLIVASVAAWLGFAGVVQAQMSNDAVTSGIAVTPLGTFTTGDLLCGSTPTSAQDCGIAPIKSYIATSNPGASNDNTQGYSVGSIGLNSATGRTFIARSVATGAAVWVMQGAPLTVSDPIVGNWFVPPGAELSGGGTALASTTTIFLVPFYLPERMTISQLGAKITVAGSTNIQAGIYNSSAATHLPTTNVDHTASIVNTSVGFVSAAMGANQQLEAGLYWYGVEANDVTVAFAAINSLSTFFSTNVGASTLSLLSGGTASNMATAVSATQSFGTWGDLTSATWAYHNNDLKNAMPFLLVNSVP